MAKHKHKEMMKLLKSYEGTIIGKGIAIEIKREERQYQKHRNKSTTSAVTTRQSR